MVEPPFAELSRRERQIMEVVYAEGEVSVREVRDRLPVPPSYSAVRTTLGILEEKGHVRHRQEGPRYLYSPRVPLDEARKAALAKLVSTFFDGSVEEAAVALLRSDAASIPDDRIEALEAMIRRAREEGR